jgi:hypothetical protein
LANAATSRSSSRCNAFASPTKAWLGAVCSRRTRLPNASRSSTPIARSLTRSAAAITASWSYAVAEALSASTPCQRRLAIARGSGSGEVVPFIAASLRKRASANTSSREGRPSLRAV